MKNLTLEEVQKTEENSRHLLRGALTDVEMSVVEQLIESSLELERRSNL